LKPQEKEMGKILHDIVMGKEFLDKTQRALETEAKKDK
jgi:hypothetical protein